MDLGFVMVDIVPEPYSTDQLTTRAATLTVVINQPVEER
jgi:hypothetical protein